MVYFALEEGGLAVKNRQNHRKMIALASVLTAMCVLLCSCAVTTLPVDKKVTVDGKAYDVIDDTECKTETFSAESDISIKFADAEELIRNNAHPECHNETVATTYLDAAKVAIPILNGAYGAWTETDGVVVDINQNANAWIATGQLESRESTFGPIGAAVFSIETGEVLYVGKGYPAT